MLANAPPCAATELQALMHDEAAQVTPESSTFWLMVAALKAFVVGAAQLGLGSRCSKCS